MTQPGKRYSYLDYPLFPSRRRPWLRLILIGVLLGVSVYWGWRQFTVDAPSLASQSTEPDERQVVLIRSQVVTPTATIPLTSTTSSAWIDEVDEIEISWAERGGRTEVVLYTVQEGDTLWSIASQFDLDVDTLRWSNPDLERNPDLLSVGMELTILPVTGIYHTVESGETVASIAQRYGVAEVDILNYPLNGLSTPEDLQAGQKLIVPHGHNQLKRPTPQPAPDSPFAWPLVGVVTQGFSEEHRAIDIGAPYGSPVYAGRAGQVTRSGWARTGYGFTVIIDHGDGLQSLYSHMKGEWVQVGNWVERGQLIGEVGSTGNSSGPHMHFEVRVEGEPMNPLDYLPPGEPR